MKILFAWIIHYRAIRWRNNREEQQYKTIFIYNSHGTILGYHILDFYCTGSIESNELVVVVNPHLIKWGVYGNLLLIFVKKWFIS